MFKAEPTLTAVLALTACGGALQSGFAQTPPPPSLTVSGTVQGQAPQAVRLLLGIGQSDIVGTPVAETTVVNNAFSLTLPTGATVEPFLKPLTFGGRTCTSQASVSDRGVRAINVTRFAGVEGGTVTGALVSFEGAITPGAPATGVVLLYVDRDLTVTGTEVCGTKTTMYNLNVKKGWNVTGYTVRASAGYRWESRASASSSWIFSRTATPFDKKN